MAREAERPKKGVTQEAKSKRYFKKVRGVTYVNWCLEARTGFKLSMEFSNVKVIYIIGAIL